MAIFHICIKILRDYRAVPFFISRRNLNILTLNTKRLKNRRKIELLIESFTRELDTS